MASRIPSVTALPCPCPFYGETNSRVWHIQPFNCSHHSWGCPSSGGPDDSHSVGRLMSGRTKTITQTFNDRISGKRYVRTKSEDWCGSASRLAMQLSGSRRWESKRICGTEQRDQKETHADPWQRRKSNAKEQKRSFPQGALEPLDGLTQKQINLDTGLTPFTNINSKWKS